MTWNIKEDSCPADETLAAFPPVTYMIYPSVRIETSRELTEDEKRRVIDALVKAASAEMIHIKEENDNGTV